MVNRVVLVGRLTRDPEMKYTPAGVAVANMSIAVDRFTKDDQGNYETDFFNIVAWRRSAEFASQYLTKGRLISVDGRLTNRSWVAQDGQKRNSFEIIADNIQGLDRKGDATPHNEGGSGSNDGGYAAVSAPQSAPAMATAGAARPAAKTAAPVDDDESDPFADE